MRLRLLLNAISVRVQSRIRNSVSNDLRRGEGLIYMFLDDVLCDIVEPKLVRILLEEIQKMDLSKLGNE